MGLLKYIAWKSTTEHKRVNSLGSQAYDATIPSVPPIRGAYPLAGNGPKNVSGRLYRPTSSLPRLEDSLAKTGSRPAARTSEPAEAVERPQTIPSNREEATESTDNGSEPESQPLEKPVYKTVPPPKRTMLDLDSHKSRLYKLPPKHYDSKPLPVTSGQPSAAGRTFSLRSADSSSPKVFVDILDAQSVLKPLDFYDRLQANGTKHYGEDVADRNIAVNGVDLDSPQVQAFYSNTVGDHVNNRAQETTTDANDLERTHSARGRSARPLSFASSTMAPSFRTVRPSHSPAPSLPDEPRLIRRSGSHRGRGDRSNAPRRMSTQSYTEPSSAGRHAVEANDDNTPYRGRHLEASHRIEPKRSSSLIQLRLPLKQADDSVFLTKNTAPELTPPRLIRISTKGGSRRSMQRYSMQSLNSLNSLPVHENIVWADSNQRHPYASIARCDTRAAGRSTPSRQQWSVNAIGPTLDNLRLHRPEDSGAERSRSAMSGRDYYYSVDSETATISSLNSNPFRPQSSLHTPNTSLDMTIDMKGMNSSQETLGTVSDHTAHEDSGSTALRSPSRLLTVPHSIPPRSANFNIDDYISTDDDSSAPRRSRGEDEKDLLFRDSDYGMGGLNLPGIPGLFGPMATVHEDNTLTKVASAEDKAVGPEHSPVHIPGVAQDLFHHRRPMSTLRMPTFGSSSSQDDLTSPELETEDDFALDIPKVRRAHFVARPMTAPVSSQEDAASMEHDVGSAARLRRDVKRQSRALGVPPVGRSKGERVRELRRPHPQRMMSEEFDADEE